MTEKQDIELLYDRECPICTFYSHRVDIADGKLDCVNARERSPLRNELTALGYDLDEGMVLRVGDELFYGSDALNRLAQMSSGKGLFNRCMSLTFRSPRTARLLYPLLTRGRSLLLRLLGRSRIDNLGRTG